MQLLYFCYLTSSLIAHIKRFLGPDSVNIEEAAEFFEARSYAKKELLLREGQRCYEKFFIVKGCVQIFYLKPNGVEQTIDFAIEDWWSSDFAAFASGGTARFSIRAIEKTQVLCISTSRQQALLEACPAMNAYFHLLFQKAYAASQNRWRLLYELSKEEQYIRFRELYPEFTQRVPQYLLASFLGLTPEYLSEIRARHTS